MRTREFTNHLPSLAVVQARLTSLRLSLASRKLGWALDYRYSSLQPRVPRGVPEGGQWTENPSGGSRSRQKPQYSGPRQTGERTGKPIPIEDSELVRIARRLLGPRRGTPAGNNLVRVAQSGRGPRGSGPGRTGGGSRFVEPTPAEEAELAASRLMLGVALNRVRAVDPRWRPTPSLTETIRGEILSNIAQAREAEARFHELQRNGIGPGPYAGESIPARSPSRRYTKLESEDLNRIGRETGCHTCGSKQSGLPSGNYYKDHQLPTMWGQPGQPQRLFPQCQSCSARQGFYVRYNKDR